VILFPNDDGGVAVCYPAACGLSVQEIARKDVPAGKPFLIVDESLIPADHMFFAAWEADFSEPHGYGIGPDAWFAEQGAEL
jgi:hypothetical protein